MNERGNVAPVIAIVLLILFLYVGFGIAGTLSALLINGLIGLVIIVLINFLPVIEIPVNIWTILIAALGGIPGIVLLILLNVLKVPLE